MATMAGQKSMVWCWNNAIDYLFGLPGNKALQRLVDEAADDIRTRRALEHTPVLRGYAETRYQAKSWKAERRACARIEATMMGLDIRFVITNPDKGSAKHIYDVIYCARGQAENLIKMHKSQLASDRTSCRSPSANQIHLVLATAPLRLLADAHPARGGPQDPISPEQNRVRHAPPPQAQRPRHRNRLAHPSGLRRRLSQGRSVPLHRHHAVAGPTSEPPTLTDRIGQVAAFLRRIIAKVMHFDVEYTIIETVLSYSHFPGCLDCSRGARLQVISRFSFR